MKTARTEREWLDELDRNFPGKVLLDSSDIETAFGVKATRASQLLSELALPTVKFGSRKRFYRKTDLAHALAERTERK